MGNSKVEMNNIEDDLKNWLSSSQRVIIAGIGNPLRKDDSVGIKIIRDLQGEVSGRVRLIECETIPESFIDSITEFAPTHILIIDAATLNLKAGTTKFIHPDQIATRSAISTHALPLQVFCKYLAETTGAKIAILAIQPEDASFGKGLTRKVETTAKHLVNLLSKILP